MFSDETKNYSLPLDNDQQDWKWVGEWMDSGSSSGHSILNRISFDFLPQGQVDISASSFDVPFHYVCVCSHFDQNPFKNQTPQASQNMAHTAKSIWCKVYFFYFLFLPILLISLF